MSNSGRLEHGTQDNPEIVTEVNSSDNWEVKDSNGNVIAVFKQDQSSEANQFTTTNETFIRATRSVNPGNTSSGTFTNAFDSSSKDVRSEFFSGTFKPDKDGEYRIVGVLDIQGNTSTGDEINIRLRDTTNNSTIKLVKFDAGATDTNGPYSFVANLSSGTDYEIQATNQNSNFEVVSGNTEGEFIWSTVQ